MRSLRLRGVSVGSELSTQEERDGWEAALGCAVRDEYSSEELGRIASPASARRSVTTSTRTSSTPRSSVRTGGRPTVSARWSGPSSTTGPCRSCATGRAISRELASSSARAAGVAASSSTLPVGRTTASSSPTVERSPRASSWTSRYRGPHRCRRHVRHGVPIRPAQSDPGRFRGRSRRRPTSRRLPPRCALPSNVSWQVVA